jgi:hypothetical protein
MHVSPLIDDTTNAISAFPKSFEGRFKSLTAKVAALESLAARVTALEQRPATTPLPPAASPPDNNLLERIAALEKRPVAVATIPTPEPTIAAPPPTPSHTLGSYTEVVDADGKTSCQDGKKMGGDKASTHERVSLLGPPGAPRCTDILHEVQHGEWVYGQDQICQSPDPGLRVLCTNNRTIGYGVSGIDPRPPGAVWRPTACAYKIFTAAEACELLGRRSTANGNDPGWLVIAGDSFERHTYQGMVNILTGDYDWGSAKCNQKYAECRGEMQYNEKACSSSYYEGVITGCGRPDKPIIKYEPWTAFHYRTHSIEQIQSMMEKASILLMGYLRGTVEETKESVFPTLFAAIAQMPKEKRPLVVFQALHSAGPLKPKKYFETQGNQALKKRNEAYWALCNELGIPVLDSYDMTLGQFSFDGTHFGMTINVLRSQIFLNYLEERENAGLPFYNSEHPLLKA